MSRQLNPSQVWSQVPVANRLIEVNTKTGFSLTAGSYTVRASSCQRALVASGGPLTTNTTVSSVTLTRAIENLNGSSTNNPDVSGALYNMRLTSTTNVQVEKGVNIGAGNQTFSVNELF